MIPPSTLSLDPLAKQKRWNFRYTSILTEISRHAIIKDLQFSAEWNRRFGVMICFFEDEAVVDG